MGFLSKSPTIVEDDGWNLCILPGRKFKSEQNVSSSSSFWLSIWQCITKKLGVLLLISETELDDSFPSAQFLIKGFSAPYRFDRNSKGGGLLFYIREDIPSKILTYSSNCDIETLLVEINLRKRKWLLNGSYNPNK